MSYIKALKKFNKKCYPTAKKMYFDNEFKDKDKIWVQLSSPPHFSPLMGSGATVEEAKENAAKAWLELWRERDDMGAKPPVNWAELEKIAGQKIVAVKDEDS